MTDEVAYAWRGPVADEEMVDLVMSHGGRPTAGWWNRISAHSLGWVSARDRDGLLVGFVNVAWDGGDHAFLIDTKTRGSHQHRGIGSELVRRAGSAPGQLVASGFTSISSRTLPRSTSMRAVFVGRMPVSCTS